MFGWLILAALVLLLVVDTVLVEVESFGWATVALLACVVGVQVFHVVPLLEWAGQHVVLSVVYTLAYVGVGVVYSFIKWFLFLLGFRDYFRQKKQMFIDYVKANDGKIVISRYSGYGPTPISLVEPWDKVANDAFTDFLRHASYRDNDLAVKPQAANNKSRIVAWMAFWPLSFIGTLVNDPVRRLFNAMFNFLKTRYQHMSDYLFRNELGLK